MLSQFGIMPLVGFILVIGFELSPEIGLGLLMIGCAPGGSTSNLYTYYAKGDLALSIAMTLASTIAAIVMMPLLISFYSGWLGIGGEIIIPYNKIVIMLWSLLVPVSIGMAIRRYSLT